MKTRMLQCTVGLFKSNPSIVLELQCPRDKRNHGKDFIAVNRTHCSGEMIPPLVIVSLVSNFLFQLNTLKIKILRKENSL